MDASEARTIGQRIRAVRRVRGKSLEVVAGLAGIHHSYLSRIEKGDRALDRLSLIVAIAEALEIAPSEIMGLSVPAPANGHTDSTTEAVRLALDGIDVGYPDGVVIPVAVLRDQVAQIHQQRRAGRFAEVATDLPGLIRNLHTTLATGADRDELLTLAVYLHVHVTRLWLHVAVVPVDLLRRVVFLTKRLAQEHGGAATLALAGFGVADVLLNAGAFDLGRAELNSLALPPITADTAGLVGLLTASHGLAAALEGRPGDVAAPMDVAADLAERFGDDPDSLGCIFGPTDTALFRMYQALETEDPDRVVCIAQGVSPERHPVPVSRAYYWVHYGRALAQLPRRRDDAVMALRAAEDIFPTKVRRDPVVRDVIAQLVTQSRQDAVGRELRGLAYRAGVQVA